MSGSVLTGLGSVLTSAGDDDGGNGLGTLAALYLAGLAGTPTADNLLVGSYYDYYFDTDGSVKQTQTASDNGAGASGFPANTWQRQFTNQAARGLMNDYRVKYNQVGGLNTSGGLFDQWSSVSEGDVLKTFLFEHSALEAGPGANYIWPAWNGGGPVTTRRLEMIGRLGTNNCFRDFNSDGADWSNPRVPASPVSTVSALIHSLSVMSGGNPPDGSGVEWLTKGPGDINSGAVMGRIRNVLDTGNFGSAQCLTHWDIYAATLAGGDAIALSIYPDRVQAPSRLTAYGGNGDPLLTFVTPEIDLTATGDTAVTGLSLSGYYFIPTGIHWVITAVAGSISTAPVTKAGNNAAKDNIMASGSNPTNAQFAIGVGSVNNGGLTVKPVAMVNMSTPIVVNVTTGATGTGLTYRAKCYIYGRIQPV